jgi:Peptidoglycan-binding protein, CsiV
VSYQDPNAAMPAPVAGVGGLTELPINPRYHLSAERSVRSGELHYFDHPAFGVLLKITPVRADPNAIAAPGSRPAA